MSWHYLPELAAGCLEADSSAGVPSAPWKKSRTAERCCCDANGTVCWTCSRSGTTSERSTEEYFVAWWMSFLRVSRANPLVPQAEVDWSQKISGPRSFGSPMRYSPSWYLSKMSLPHDYTDLCCPLPKWAHLILEDDCGFVATPTTMANQWAPSMQKHPGCRRLTKLFGKPTPTIYEWLMGWPIGWTALEPLGMDRFQPWLDAHGNYSSTGDPSHD